jgi:hypothetical protein
MTRSSLESDRVVNGRCSPIGQAGSESLPLENRIAQSVPSM